MCSTYHKGTTFITVLCEIEWREILKYFSSVYFHKRNDFSYLDLAGDAGLDELKTRDSKRTNVFLQKRGIRGMKR